MDIDPVADQGAGASATLDARMTRRIAPTTGKSSFPPRPAFQAHTRPRGPPDHPLQPPPSMHSFNCARLRRNTVLTVFTGRLNCVPISSRVNPFMYAIKIISLRSSASPCRHVIRRRNESPFSSSMSAPISTPGASMSSSTPSDEIRSDCSLRISIALLRAMRDIHVIGAAFCGSKDAAYRHISR